MAQNPASSDPATQADVQTQPIAQESGAPRRDFIRLSVLTLLVYAVLAAFYNLPALSSVSTPDLSFERLTKEILVWPVTFLLLWTYWRGAKALTASEKSPKNGIPAWWIVVSGLGLAILAALTPPFHSTDMFGYVNRGWQQVHYHLNPYVYTVAAIPHWETDPMITNHWVNNPSPYGFLYLLIAKGLCLLGHGDRALTLTVFKLGNLMMHLLTAGLVWLGVKRLNDKQNLPFSGRICPTRALYLYLWNPLVLINTLANGHNDIYMGFFVTLGGVLALMGGWLWILPALMAATLIKYGAVVIFPVAGLFLIRQKAWKALILGGLIALGIFGLTGLPYLPDWQHFHLKEINQNAFVSHGSLHSFVFTLFKTLTRSFIPAEHPFRELVRTLLKNTLLLTYAAFFGGLLWKRLRQPQYPATGFVRDALLVMSVLVCMISLKFYPWYFGMFFPLALLLPEGDVLRRWVLVVSGAQLFAITFIGQAHMLNFLVMTGLPTLWVIQQARRQAKNGATALPVSELAATNSQPPTDHSATAS